MSLKKVLLKNTTRMSLHERFTFLRSQPEPVIQMSAIRQRNFNEQQATARNRRLAQQMERRPTVLAALRIKKSLKQRLGQTTGLQSGSIKDRLLLNRGGFRGRRGNVRSAGNFGQGVSPLRQNRGRGGFGSGGRGGKLKRSLSTGNLSRSQSMQSLSGRSIGNGRFRGRLQSRGGAVQRSPSLGRMNNRRGNRGTGRGSFQGNDNFRNRRGVGNPRFNTRGGGRGGMRGGSFRGRGGRGRGRGMNNNTGTVTREELDTQLDQYMSNTKVHLDKELDSYMSKGKDDEMWD